MAKLTGLIQMTKSFRRRKTVWKGLLAFLTVIIITTSFYVFSGHGNDKLSLSNKNKAEFTYQPILNQIFALFDVGIADINSDQNLDIYTSNHSGQQYLLPGDGRGNFSENELSRLGLDQAPKFPGFSISTTPKVNAPGLYIYWEAKNGRSFVLKSHKMNDTETGSVAGEIDFSAAVRIKQQKGFDVSVKRETIPTGAKISTLRFSAQSANGQLVLSPYHGSLPITFRLDKKIPLEQVYIGRTLVHPSSHTFDLSLKDRHSMAWVDLDGKGLLDLFINRGDAKGEITLYPEGFGNDELLIHSGSKYQNEAEPLGIKIGACMGTHAAWVDFDNDGRLDLYKACFRGSGEPHPNQLFHQLESGEFVDEAKLVGLDIAPRGAFAWVDANGDQSIDLLWVDQKEFRLYLNRSGKFSPQLIGSNPGSLDVSKSVADGFKLVVSDYDNDGDFDAFSSSSGGNSLLVNDGGTYTVVDPKVAGLPAKSLMANWVDYDQDGLTDLHLMPDGLFRQTKNHQFEATKLLASQSSKLFRSRTNWFDANGDGSRDLLVANQYYSPVVQQLYDKIRNFYFRELVVSQDWNWYLSLYPNLSNTNHWLQVELIGQPGNSAAIGANVELSTEQDTQLQTIGQSEGSLFSQGHYRLYFGLGDHKMVNSVKVTWPNGYIQTIRTPKIDQLLVIQQEKELANEV